MLTREDRNLVKSALKRRYNEFVNGAGGRQLVNEVFAGNPVINDYKMKAQAKRAISGRGSYMRDLGEAVGEGIGGLAGNRHIGRAIGRSMFGAATRMVTGRGAYQFRGQNHRVNRLFVENPSDSTIEVEEDVDGIILTRSEFLKQVSTGSSGLTNVLTGDVNPLNSELFPWLSQIAQYYREYELIQCFVEFESTVTGGDTTAKGDVIMSSLTPFDDLFTDASTLQNYYSSVSAGTDSHILCGIECGKRTGTGLLPVKLTPTGGNPADYNVGQIQVATNGAADDHAIGNLYIHYMIRLIKPLSKLASNVSFVNSVSNAALDVSDGGPMALASQTQTNPLGATVSASSLTVIPAAGATGKPESSLSVAKFLGTSLLYYKLAPDSTPVALSSGATVVWLANEMANQTIRVALRVAVLAQASGPYSDTYPTVATFGNVTLLKSEYAANSDYLAGYSQLSKIGNSALAEGFVINFEFTLTVGDVNNDFKTDEGATGRTPGGFAFSLVGEGVSVTYGTTMQFSPQTVSSNLYISPLYA
jgi:hypothetical protein